MFHILLGGALILAASLLAAASYSDGALIPLRTATQVTGWLFVSCVLVHLCIRTPQRDAFKGLRHATFAEVTAAAVTFFSGVSMLYVSYFEWNEFPSAAMRYAETETVVDPPAEYKLIGGLPPVPTLASAQIFTPLAKKHSTEDPVREQDSSPTHLPAKNLVARVSLPQATEDPCSAFNGVEALQCHRCVKESGLALLMCHERARLEYCEDRQAEEPGCPSAIPYSPPQ